MSCGADGHVEIGGRHARAVKEEVQGRFAALVAQPVKCLLAKLHACGGGSIGPERPLEASRRADAARLDLDPLSGADEERGEFGIGGE